jgi:S1-C subfamily serine protease
LALILFLATSVLLPGQDTSRSASPAVLDSMPPAAAAVAAVEMHIVDGEGKQVALDAGTAFLVHPAGYLVTCHHVVRRAPGGMLHFKQGPDAKFTVLARIPQYDLAVLKADAAALPAPVDLRIPAVNHEGESVVAIGNLLAKGLATTRGSVAATGRALNTDCVHVDNAMLLDLTLAPGASGGPIFGSDGRVLGITVSRPDERINLWDALDVGLIARACEEVVNLKCMSGLDPGLDVAGSETGLCVTRVPDGSPAQLAGVQVGDIVASVEDWPVRSIVDYHFSTLAWAAKRGGNLPSPMKLTLSRGTDHTVVVANIQPELRAAKALDEGTLSLKPGCSVTVSPPKSEEPCLVGWSRGLDMSIGPQGGEPCRVTYRGYLRLPVEGTYAFYLGCQGIGRLEVGDSLVVEKKVDHPPMVVAGRQYLATGLHTLRLSMTGKPQASPPVIQVEGPGASAMQPLPASWLFDAVPAAK